jgi:hypothetical protein
MGGYYKPYARPNRIPAKRDRNETHNRKGKPFSRRSSHRQQRLRKEFNERIKALCKLLPSFSHLHNRKKIKEHKRKSMGSYSTNSKAFSTGKILWDQ